MIDTINIKFKFDDNNSKALECINAIEEVSGEGKKITNWEDNTLISYVNRIYNLKVSIDPTFMYIQGSITKFYLGNNIQTLTINDIRDAYNKLILIFKGIIDLSEAVHTRLDISANIVTLRGFSNYDDCILKSKRKDKWYYHSKSDTAYIGNNSQKFIIYDKMKDYKKELKKNKYLKIDNNEETVDNLIRIEYQILEEHVFEKLFKNKRPTIKQIIDDVKIIPKIWFDEYNKLNKVDISGLDACKSNSTDDILSYSLLKAGIKNIQDHTDMNWKEKNITYEQRRTVNKWIDKALEFSNKYAKENSPIFELDKKINSYYENYIHENT